MLIPLVLLVGQVNGFAKNLSDEENVIIKSQVGCFEVTTHFQETGKTDSLNPISSRNFLSKSYEWIVLDQEENNKISLQHVVLTPFGPKKYLREEWERGASKYVSYVKPNRWEQNPYATKTSQWSLTVRNPDESYQYQCAAPLTIVRDDFAYWECSSLAPVPRRELIQRSDYQLFGRKQFLVFSGVGFIDRQSNRKMNPTLSEDFNVIAWEDGFISNKKVDEQYCQEAKDWWAKNSVAWSKVRDVWSIIFNKYYAVELKKMEEGKALSDDIFSLVAKTQETLSIVSETSLPEADVYKQMQGEVIKNISKYIKDVNEEGEDK